MSMLDAFGKRRAAGNGQLPEIKIPDFLETSAPRLSADQSQQLLVQGQTARATAEPDSRMTREVEDEIGEFIRANKMAQSPEGPIDLESPPERAVEIANLITTGFEVYATDMRKVRRDVIAHAARTVYEIDSMIAELTLARDRIAADHQAFMHSVRNRVVAIIDARRTIATKAPAQETRQPDEQTETPTE